MANRMASALKLATSCVYGSEGYRSTAFLDTLARPPVWTIGHGTTRIDNKLVLEGMTCTRAQADDWAMTDMEAAAKYVLHCVTMPLNDWQLAALTSFCYNIGMGNFNRSTVKAALNLGLYGRAADAMLDYDEAGGKPVAGLSSRRGRERALFLTGMEPAEPVAVADAADDEGSADALNAAELADLNKTS